jgi:hypothetical protein
MFLHRVRLLGICLVVDEPRKLGGRGLGRADVPIADAFRVLET